MYEHMDVVIKFYGCLILLGGAALGIAFTLFVVWLVR